MTIALSCREIARRINITLPGSIVESTDKYLVVKSESLPAVASCLKNTPDFDFQYLNYIVATDYFDYFEVVYQLTSIKQNHTLVLKTRCYDRRHPVLPSVCSQWQGADFQEREIYDLMGIMFEGHPGLKRIFLWEGFQGYPLRKDYL